MFPFKYKQVIAVRTDLPMSKGKLAVQVAHAAISAAEVTKREREDWWRAWIKEGQCKVAVKVGSEEELRKLKREAEALHLPTALVEDRGLTELPPGSVTCLGIGPAPVEIMDEVTRRLPLL